MKPEERIKKLPKSHREFKSDRRERQKELEEQVEAFNKAKDSVNGSQK